MEERTGVKPSKSNTDSSGPERLARSATETALLLNGLKLLAASEAVN